MIAKYFAYVPIAFAAVCALQGAPAANTTITTNPAIANYARPVSFEPNRGQTGKQVDFLAHGTGYTLFLSHAEAVMVFRSGAAVRMSPVGANASISAAALDEQASKSNYFIGDVPERWRTDIPNYAKVHYANVYRGIDLIYYGNQRQLEYDFVVKPGADPGLVELQFDGPSKAALDRSGELVMHTDSGELRWHKPVAYQEVNGSRKLIECAYTNGNANRLRFAVRTYDHSQPLIIDPVLVYSTYLGGSAGDAGTAIAVDEKGNAYVTGLTISTDFPTKNAFQKTLKSSLQFSNAFVTKFNTLGELVYSTYLGGSGSIFLNAGDSGAGIAVDVLGNAYVTGVALSADFPTKNAFQKTLKSSYGNAFVTKLVAAGDALVYSTYLGGSGVAASIFGDSGNGITVDAHGNAYVTGFTPSVDFPTKNAFQKTLRSSNGNAFVTKLSPVGELLYSTFLGGSSPALGDGDEGRGIAVDTNGQAYVTGDATHFDFPTKNPFQKGKPNTDGGAFVTKFNAAGNALVYSTFLGESSFGLSSGRGIAVDAHGQASVTGFTQATDFPIKNAFQRVKKGPDGSNNAFVTKFEASGSALVFSTFLGGSSEFGGEGLGIAVDAGGNSYVTGFTEAKDFPVKNAFQKEYAGGIPGSSDAFVSKFCPVGTLVYSSYLGGKSGDNGRGIAVDAEANAYVAGDTSSPDFPTKNAFQPVLGGPGAQNAFVTKISAK